MALSAIEIVFVSCRRTRRHALHSMRYQEVCPQSAGATYNKALRMRRAFFILLASYSSAIQVIGDTVREHSETIIRRHGKMAIWNFGEKSAHSRQPETWGGNSLKNTVKRCCDSDLAINSTFWTSNLRKHLGACNSQS